MRVVLVGSYPVDPERVQGGVEASVSTLVSALAELPGLDLRVITFVPGLDRAEEREVGGVPIDYLPTIRRLRSVTMHVRERRALARRIEALRPDLVHAQDAVRHGFICLKAIGDRVPLVLSIHGIARAELPFVTSRVTRLRMAIADIAVERYCIGHARYLVQPTRYPEQYFGDEIRGRIWDVGNPIADAFFGVDRAPDGGRMLYLGAFIARKRLLDLVDALPLVLEVVPTASLRVVGFAANPEYAESVRARVAELGLGERVTFLQGLTSDEVLDEYRRASVLVLPSGEETSPMVIGEAMAAGVPVVATRVGGVSYLVDDDVTGSIVEAGDVATLADRIAAILGDASKRDAFGAAGRAKAESRFRAEAVAGRVRDVYEKVLAATRSR